MRPIDSDHLRDPSARSDEPDLFRFLDVYAPALLSDALRARASRTEGLFLTVIVRTQGTRSALLREALLCLAAQDCADFEVVVVAHDAGHEAQHELESDLGLVEAVLPGRVHLVHAGGGSRSRPVSVGLDHASGHYAAVLDDDDHVLADWVSTFHRLWVEAPGKVVRVGAAVRQTQVLRERSSGPRIAVSAPHPKYCDPWSFDDHLAENRTPFHAFAFPLFAVRDLGIHFDDSLDVVEDWDFLMRAAGALGVHETQKVTAIYNLGGQDASRSIVIEAQWRAVEDRVRERHHQAPRLVATPIPASRMARLTPLRKADWRAVARSISYVYSTEGMRGVAERVKARVLDYER